MVFGRRSAQVVATLVAATVAASCSAAHHASVPTTAARPHAPGALRSQPQPPAVHLGACPKNDPGESRTPYNENVRGLNEQLVPFRATSVRVCSYQPLPTGEDAVTSGTPMIGAANLERETNALEVYHSRVEGGCVESPKDVVVTFANASRRSSVVVALGCAGGVSNRVLVAKTTTKWVHDVQDFATASLNAVAVTGVWQPVTIAGYHGSLASPPLTVAPQLAFDGKHAWSGSDGCNYLSGAYRFGVRGLVHFSVVSTKRGCRQATPPDVLQRTTRAEIVNGLLTFFDRAGSRLAQYSLASLLPPSK
jgi:heat shock protein HslJ